VTTPNHCVVVDTNVLAVAEGLHDHASEECVLACIRLLRAVIDGKKIVGVDDADGILGEYLKTLGESSRAGVGQKLASRLWRTRYDPNVCHRVEITPIDDPPGSFSEVPLPLRDFDADDQRFLAVAAAEGVNPPIFQALDQEWWQRRPDMAANGLDVQFLCATDRV
jgi:hypothetical protein